MFYSDVIKYSVINLTARVISIECRKTYYKCYWSAKQKDLHFAFVHLIEIYGHVLLVMIVLLFMVEWQGRFLADLENLKKTKVPESQIENVPDTCFGYGKSNFMCY